MAYSDTSDYSWFTNNDYSTIWTVGFCFTFICDRTPDQVEELLHSSLGAPRERGGDRMQLFVAQVYPTTGGSFIAERGGFAGAMHKVVSELSRSTKLATVMRGFHSQTTFVYAVDGEVVTAFDVFLPGYRRGASPDALNDELTVAGLLPAYEYVWNEDDEADDDRGLRGEVIRALSVATAVTGIRFGEEHLEDSSHAVSLAHLYTSESDAAQRLA